MCEYHKNYTVSNDIIIDMNFKNLLVLPNIEFFYIQLLYLNNNQLTELPENFFKDAPMLKWLDVRNNQLEKIPISIKNHANIETMLLQNNKISYLPLELGTVKKLKYIQLNGNPLLQPKKCIIKLGTDAILKHLRLQYIQENSSDLFLTDNNLIDITLKQCDADANNKSGSNNKTLSKNKPASKSLKRISFPDLCLSDSPIMSESNLKLTKYSNSHKYVKYEKARSKDEQTVLIQKNIMKDIWMEKKKEIVNNREKALQDKKSLAALKNWRNNYRNLKAIEPNTYYALDLSNIPYDIDLNQVKILTRADIEKDLPDKYRTNITKKRNIKSTKTKEKQTIHAKIAQLTDSVRSIHSENSEWTPRTEKKIIGCRIQKLTDLKNKIVKLKLENDKCLE